MLQQQQTDLKSQIVQAAQYAHELMMNGAPQEQIEALLSQFVAQMTQEQTQGQTQGQQPSAPSQPQAPQGTTGELAMKSMAQGM
jgi:hypothetical protein